MTTLASSSRALKEMVPRACLPAAVRDAGSSMPWSIAFLATCTSAGPERRDTGAAGGARPRLRTASLRRGLAEARREPLDVLGEAREARGHRLVEEHAQARRQLRGRGAARDAREDALELPARQLDRRSRRVPTQALPPDRGPPARPRRAAQGCARSSAAPRVRDGAIRDRGRPRRPSARRTARRCPSRCARGRAARRAPSASSPRRRSTMLPVSSRKAANARLSRGDPLEHQDLFALARLLLSRLELRRDVGDDQQARRRRRPPRGWASWST